MRGFVSPDGGVGTELNLNNLSLQNLDFDSRILIDDCERTKW